MKIIKLCMQLIGSEETYDRQKKVTICSVGDLMLCDSPLYVSVGVGANYSRIRKDLFSACASDLKNADITIGNFEGVVCHPKKKNLQELQMACEENTIKDLKLNGFNILNLANNHCLQHGTNNFFGQKRYVNRMVYMSVE